MDGSAIFDDDRKFRFYLERRFVGTLGTLMFVLNNPSTADAKINDNTLNRGISWARLWGFQKLVYLNTNPWRATSPKDQGRPSTRILVRNDFYLKREAAKAALIICAWGDDALPDLALRAETKLLSVAERLYAMRLNKSGTPAHILYLPGDLKPILWRDVNHFKGDVV